MQLQTLILIEKKCNQIIHDTSKPLYQQKFNVNTWVQE